MINVTLGAENTQKEKPFPKLMSTESGYLVLFFRSGYGLTLRYPEHTSDKVFELSSDWIMLGFTDYNEPITIQNA